MSENKKTDIPENAVEEKETELTEDELDDVAGGAARMLSGRRTRGGSARPSGGSTKLAAGTGTTLCEWHNCTHTISGC